MVVHEPDRVRAACQRIGQTEAGGAFEELSAVLCEPTRRRIVEALSAAELPVSDLAATLGRSVPVISRHLRVLRELGVVEGERRASRVYYRLQAGPPVGRVRQLFHAIRAHPGDTGPGVQTRRHSAG